MTWNILHNPIKQTGTLAEVYLDDNNTLIKKIYKEEGITVSGKPTVYTTGQIREAFENELHWLKELESKWVPELVDVGDNWLTQKYYGPDLLENYMSKTLWEDVPSISNQVIDMYKFFKEKNVFKRNGSLSNLTVHNGQLVAFDFKWARKRPTGIEMELKSYNEWLVKIDPDLTKTLTDMI